MMMSKQASCLIGPKGFCDLLKTTMERVVITLHKGFPPRFEKDLLPSLGSSEKGTPRFGKSRF